LTPTEQLASLAAQSQVCRRGSPRGKSTVFRVRQNRGVNILCEGQVVSLNCVIDATKDVFTGSFRVSGIEEIRVKLEHFTEVFDRLFVILLLFCQFSSGVEGESVLIVRLNLYADLLL